MLRNTRKDRTGFCVSTSLSLCPATAYEMVRHRRPATAFQLATGLLKVFQLCPCQPSVPLLQNACQCYKMALLSHAMKESGDVHGQWLAVWHLQTKLQQLKSSGSDSSSGMNTCLIYMWTPSHVNFYLHCCYDRPAAGMIQYAQNEYTVHCDINVLSRSKYHNLTLYSL